MGKLSKIKWLRESKNISLKEAERLYEIAELKHEIRDLDAGLELRNILQKLLDLTL